MKRHIARTILLIPVYCLITNGSALADDFWDLFASEIVTVGVTSSINVGVNSSNVGATFSDPNSNGLFETGETLNGSLVIRNRKDAVALASPADLTRDELSDWANANVNAILDVIFPQGLSEITGATDDAMLVGATVSNNLFAKVVPSRKQEQTEIKETTQEVQARVEYIDLEVDNDNGEAFSMVFGYNSEYDSGFSYAATMPYRYTSMDDDLESESHFLGLDLSCKGPLKEWDQSAWHVGVSIFGSAYYLETETIDKSGNLKYGAGVFTSLRHDLGFANLSYGIDYRIAKAYLPSGMNSDNEFLELAVDYINDELDAAQTLSYGVNLGIPFYAHAVNLEIVRSSYLSNDVPDGQENATDVKISGSYFPTDTFEIDLGINSTYELEDVERLGIMLGVIHKF